MNGDRESPSSPRKPERSSRHADKAHDRGDREKTRDRGEKEGSKDAEKKAKKVSCMSIALVDLLTNVTSVCMLHFLSYCTRISYLPSRPYPNVTSNKLNVI